MAHSGTLTVDGNSPLSRYIQFLIAVPKSFERAIDRDAEAMCILTSMPALPEAIRRVDSERRDRQHGQRTGSIVRSPRVWTRRDERRLNMLRGLNGGFWPACRVARLVARFQPRSGYSQHATLFRNAVDESRRDGTAAVLCPILDKAKAAYERLIAAARLVADDEGGRSSFDLAKIELGTVSGELMNWTKPSIENRELVDTFTTDELAQLAGVRPKTLLNRLSESRQLNDPALRPPAPIKIGGRGKDRHSYAANLPWLRRTFPSMLFPDKYENARESLSRSAQVSSAGKTSP